MSVLGMAKRSVFGALILLVVAVLGATVVQTTRAAQAPPSFLFAWGTQGDGNGQFQFIQSMTIDAVGNVYVADVGIQKFDATGQFISKWGTSGSGDGEFLGVSGMATDVNGNLYVTDVGNNRVQKFDSQGNFLLKWGSAGSGDGQFNLPKGITVDPSGNVFVVDSNNNRVQKFDSQGNFLLKWGEQGSNADGMFWYPRWVDSDSQGNIYIRDEDRIEKYDGAGNLLGAWGSIGDGDSDLIYGFTDGMAIDNDDNVLISSSEPSKPALHRIQMFDSQGTFLTKWGSQGTSNGQFDSPGSIAVHPNGNIYVADAGNYRIQVFTSLPSTGNNELFLPSVLRTQSGVTPTPTPTELACNASGGSGGLAPGTSTTITFQNRPVLVRVSASYADRNPGYLTIYLHGDEGAYNTPIDGVTEGGVYIAPRALLDPDTGFYPWYNDPDAHTAFLVALLESVYSQYNLCRGVLIGGSASGGSVFFDRNFYPRQGDTYPAFWNINCGGSAPFLPDDQNKLIALSQQPAILARTEMAYTIGTEDFLFAQTSQSADYHESLGFPVVKNYLNGVEHCAYDVNGTVGDYMQAKATALNSQVNRPPKTVDDEFGATIDSSVLLDVLANDSDPNGDALTLTAVSSPSRGTAVIENGQIRYATTNAAQPGADVFTYTVGDGKGASNTATVTVTLTQNGPPNARDDGFVAPRNGGKMLLDVLYNDLDANQSDGDILTVTQASTPVSGTASVEGGRLYFTPAPGITGTVAFSYTVADSGNLTDSATVSVTVEPVGGIVVNTEADELNSDGDCSLREAIQAANTDSAVDGCRAGEGADTIYLPAGLYRITRVTSESGDTPTGESDNVSGDFDILAALTIQGATAGSTIVDGNQIDRVFHVARVNLPVTLRDLTIQNGSARPQSVQGTVEAFGGGVAVYPTTPAGGNSGVLTVERAVIQNNRATTGAGIVTYPGVLSLHSSSVISNYAAGVATIGQTTIVNSTFVRNGVEFAGNSGQIQSSTFDMRGVTERTYAFSVWTGTLTVRNNVVLGDSNGRGCSVIAGGGTAASGGYNVISDATCNFTQTGDLQSQAVDVSELVTSGGTPSLAPALDSPVYNAIPNGVNGCGGDLTADQRGVSRPQGSGCEIGAHEVLTAP